METAPRHPFVTRWSGRLALAVVVFVTLAPLWFAWKSAVTRDADLFPTAAQLWPREVTAFNFQRILGLIDPSDPRLEQFPPLRFNFSHALLNSCLFTVSVVVSQILFSAAAAYAFARLSFPGRNALFFCFIAASMIPGAVLFVPNFILIRELGLLNTMVGMAAPFALMTPFSVFYLRQVFLSTPRDVEEAAVIDGASHASIFFRIVLPLHKGSLVTLTLLSTVSTWNEFFWPSLVGREESSMVIAVALNTFRAQQEAGVSDWTGLMAAACLSALPMLLLLVIMSKQVVQSFQFSGGK